ncbi:MAG TPA: ABC transporter permease [Propionicimonas sp.]
MSLADIAAQHGLHRVGARPKLGKYLKQTWDRRDFIVALAKFRLQSDLSNNRLGIVWLVLRPMLNAAVYGLIFGLLQGSSRGADYPATVVTGVFLFEYFSSSLSRGAKSVTGNRSLVQSLAFPRLTLPVAEVIEGFFSLLPSLVVLAILLPFFGHPPTWSWLLLVPLLAIFTVFNAGVAMFVARLTVHVQDLTQFLPFVTRILFYTSGVLFNVDTIFKAHPWVLKLYDFHPIYQVLRIARTVLMGNQVYDPMYWWYFTAWAVVAFVGGLLFFWVAEERYGRD